MFVCITSVKQIPVNNLFCFFRLLEIPYRWIFVSVLVNHKNTNRFLIYAAIFVAFSSFLFASNSSFSSLYLSIPASPNPALRIPRQIHIRTVICAIHDARDTAVILGDSNILVAVPLHNACHVVGLMPAALEQQPAVRHQHSPQLSQMA